MKELGSGCGRDVGGGRWMDGRLEDDGRREGGENRCLHGRKAGLLCQFSAGRRLVEGGEDVLTPVNFKNQFLEKVRTKRFIIFSNLPLLYYTPTSAPPPCSSPSSTCPPPSQSSSSAANVLPVSHSWL